MTPRNGYITWSWFITTIIGLCLMSMGASWAVLDKHEQNVYDVIKNMQVDLREIRNDVKDLLKKGE